MKALIPGPTVRERRGALVSPSWWLQSGLERPSWVNLKRRHPIQNLICYVGGWVKKLCMRQGVSGSSPADCRVWIGVIIFFSPADPADRYVLTFGELRVACMELLDDGINLESFCICGILLVF
jgi:hypothetical protein